VSDKRRAPPFAAKSPTRVLFDGLRRELQSFTAKDVDAFIGLVGSAVIAASATKQWANEGERRQKLLKRQQAARAYLRIAGSSPVLARPYPARISSASPHTLALPDDDAKRFYRAQEAARAAVAEELRETALALESINKNPRGKPKADTTGLLARVAHGYRETFGKRPTSTPGGTFANVATLVLQYQTGKMPRDVSRQVRAALNKAL
jgi:hypothetical protein